MRPPSSVAVRLVILAAVASTLSAAELVVRDLDAGILARPTAFSYTITTPSIERSDNDAWSGGSGFVGGYRHSLSRPGDSYGLVVGLEGAADGYLYNQEGTFGTFTGRPSLGAGWAPFDGWTFIGEAGYSAGVATLDLPATKAAPAFTAQGSGSGYDLRASAWWSATGQLQVGVLAGWQTMTWKVSGDNSTDMTFTQSGMCYGLGIAWRFSSAPTRLE